MSMILLAIAVTPLSMNECLAMDSSIVQLVQSIDDNPDPLHADYTPSVHQLIEKGLPAVPPVLVLMRSDSKDTRLHAQRVLEGITMKRFGFVIGKGWAKADGEEKWRELWKKLGNMQWDESLERRNKSIVLWEKWLKEAAK
jgi:hypothetical protein